MDKRHSQGYETQRELMDDRLKFGDVDNAPDVGLVFGAPNEYEKSARHMLGAIDADRHADDPLDVLVVPDEDYAQERDGLLPEETEIQGPDRPLETTIDDVESGLTVASKGDLVGLYTSDYHSRVAHYTTTAAHDGSLQTYGADTDLFKRESPLKHNTVTQTLANGPRQLYKMAKRESV